MRKSRAKSLDQQVKELLNKSRGFGTFQRTTLPGHATGSLACNSGSPQTLGVGSTDDVAFTDVDEALGAISIDESGVIITANQAGIYSFFGTVTIFGAADLDLFQLGYYFVSGDDKIPVTFLQQRLYAVPATETLIFTFGFGGRSLPGDWLKLQATCSAARSIFVVLNGVYVNT